MTTQHTPGPWTLEYRGYKFIVSKPGDGYITRDVCRMDGSTMAAFAQEANARLIAAAPELLDILQEAIKPYKGFTGGNPPWVYEARSAIAKATGSAA